MNKYIHNVSGVTKIYIGEELATTDYMLIDPLKEKKFQQDEDLIADITAGDTLMSRDGIVDLSITDSLIFLALDDATSITGIIVGVSSTPTNEQSLLYNSTSEELEWGDPSGVSTNNFSYEEIDDAVEITIPTFQEMGLADTIEVRGTLIINGSLAVGNL